MIVSSPRIKMKILHGPFNIGNHPWSLSRAERRLGNKSDLVVRYGTWFRYPADKILYDEKVSNFQKIFRSTLFGLLALLRYDVFHYYFGMTFLYPGFSFPNTSRTGRILNRLSIIDLEVAKRLGKKRFMTLQGCDVRLAGEGNKRNEWTMCGDGRCSAYGTCLSLLDARRRYLIDRVLPMFDCVFYLNPELGHAVPQGKFLPYANVELDKFTPEYPSPQGKPRIVHAPSDASIKGTKLILEALELLKARFEFEVILVEKKTHEEALAIYRSADIAIDQVLSGWYGGFAVEMMAMGKPVVCYIRESDLEFVPQPMREELALLNVNPGQLADDLAAILERRAEWPELGKRARRFVERWHDPDHIAETMIAAYRSSDSAFVLSSQRSGAS